MSSSPSTNPDPSSSTLTPRKFLRKIPPIPIHRPPPRDESTDVEDNEESDVDDEEESDDFPGHENDTPIIHASSLGLNHIRTRSAPSPSPLRFSSTALAPSNNVRETRKDNAGTHHMNPSEQGKKVNLSQSKSSRLPSPSLEHAGIGKEFQSPRFQAIIRLTSGRKKKSHDVKSFSHELNSRGVRPIPVWKSRAHMEEIMVTTRAKFDRMKEEVDSDLGIFAGDLVSIIENISETDPESESESESKEKLEDLLIAARNCAKMSPSEFWVKCEDIVQNLDDRRQELPMGILKQAHTRLLFVLTRCTRLVQFYKESGYEDEHILSLHQLSDLGVYPLEIPQHDCNGPLGGNEASAKNREKVHVHEQAHLVVNQNKLDQNVEVCTAKSVDSTTSSYRMSSWKKLPSAAERNRKGSEAGYTPTKDKAEQLQKKDETKIGSDENSEDHETPSCHPPTSELKKLSLELWGAHHYVSYENSMICRICEVEIPIVHVEEHSRICTIADRCDLKGLTVNERLERVAETLDKILESWTPKTTPRSTGSPRENAEMTRFSTSYTHDELDHVSQKRNSFSQHCSEDILDCLPDVDTYIIEDLNVLPDISCETRSALAPDQSGNTSSAGSLTPRSPLLTPRTSQIELLLTGRRTISELENNHQISKLLDIARSIVNINDCDYNALDCMLHLLEDLKYAIQDRKVDALVVETFGRRLEKLLQEKYILLCGQIDDDKIDSLKAMGDDEESSVEDDAVRSLRTSPINPSTKDRTSIEDFEIIRPISRGAFGRVFLAKKRATGDLFAIKVLKKADMIRKNAVESILAERNILISVRNPFVVRFFYSFTCRENLYLVMEYLNGGDLYSLLKNLGCLDEEMARVYIAEIVLALEYLHSLNVIHRDLKPDNLLIGQDGHIKLTDFGLSKVGLINSTDDLSGLSLSTSSILVDDKPTSRPSLNKEQRQKRSVVGTPDYLAPEILLGMGHGATADWWSVGIILFELLVGIPPFNAETPPKIFDNIMNRNIPWPKIPEEISHEAFDLINKLMAENPFQRLGATGAREVKRHPFFKDINWDTLARQKVMFIPSAEPQDTCYFMSRYIWNPEDENVNGASDFDDLTDTCSSGSPSYLLDEDGDEFGTLADFTTPNLALKYSFSNFSFKSFVQASLSVRSLNLSQLASINYDLVVKNAKESAEASKESVPQ